MALTELGLGGVPRGNRDENFGGKAPYVPPPSLTALGLWGSSITSVPNSAFGTDASGIFPVHLYLDSVSIIGR